MSAYALRKNELVQRATLLEVGSWSLGKEADEGTRTALFRIRELIVFAALAKRRLFRGHLSGYCHFDTYGFVIQNYRAGNTRAFSFQTRHRDTAASHLWSADEFAFMKPLHINANSLVDVDQALLSALLQADAAGKLPYEAIIEFNRANTDSPDVPRHIELVLVKSAFEYLFGISEKYPEFVSALDNSAPRRTADTAPDGPLAQDWRNARPAAVRPLEAWAREFCDLRGGAAHGKERGGRRFVWSEDAHLAYAALLFPLLVKQRLARDGYLVLDERDVLELALAENYLMHDPFGSRDRRQAEEHPWSAVYTQDVMGEMLRRGLLESLRNINCRSPADGVLSPAQRAD